MNCENCKWKKSKVCISCPNSSTVQTPNVESVTRNEQVAKTQNNRVYQKFSVQVHHRTNRLSDADGRSIKAALDGLVEGGILPDDSPKFIPQIPSQTQELTKGQEETIITVNIIGYIAKKT